MHEKTMDNGPRSRHHDPGGAFIFMLLVSKPALFTAHSGLIRNPWFSYHRGPPSGWGGLQGLLQVQRGNEHASEWTAGPALQQRFGLSTWQEAVHRSF